MRGWSMGPCPSLLIVKCYFRQLLDKITARGWRRRLSCPLIYPLLVWLLYDPQLLSWTLWKRAVPKEGASSLLSIWLRGSNYSLISSRGGLWGNAPHMLFLRLTVWLALATHGFPCSSTLLVVSTSFWNWVPGICAPAPMLAQFCIRLLWIWATGFNYFHNGLSRDISLLLRYS